MAEHGRPKGQLNALALSTLFLLGIFSSHAAAADPYIAEDPVSVDIEWPEFLGRHDLVWDRLDHKDMQGFYSGAQIGNGNLGLAIFPELTVGDKPWNIEPWNENLIFEVGCKDVVDTRERDWDDGSVRVPPTVKNPRLPIGYFTLDPVGTVQDATMRVDLWNAEARGTITTDQGTITWRAFSHATEEWMAVDITTTGTEEAAGFEFTPRLCISPVFMRRPERQPDDYELPPDSERSEVDGVNVVRQPLFDSGKFSTGWLTINRPNTRRYYISVKYTPDPGDTSQPVADELNALSDDHFEDELLEHRAWWHEFWPGSFISLPDPKMESNYYIQLYRFASATRPDRPMIDLLDPWMTASSWPAVWWDLNTQLSYEWIPATGRLFLHESLNKALLDNEHNLEANAPGGEDTINIGHPTTFDLRADGGKRLGCWHWVMRSCWLWQSMDANDEALRDWIYRMMVKGANHTERNFLWQNEEGVYHLRVSQNPEHGGGPDCTFALANYRWLLQTLIRSAERLELDEPKLAEWRDILENLVDYHVDPEIGLKISETKILETSHRHFSHMFPLYLGLLDLDDPDENALAHRSLEHFMTVGGIGGGRTGYSYGGASAMFSRLGRSAEAYEHIRYLVLSELLPNTSYRESGGPVSETAYASAGWTQELMLQYQPGPNGENRMALFPGFPQDREEAVFHNLAAPGAFRVSARRENGRTAWARIISLAGEPCVVQGDFGGAPNVTGSEGLALEKLRENRWRITGLDAGEYALLYAGETPPETPAVAPLPGPESEFNHWGSDRALDQNVPDYPEVRIRSGAYVTASSR